MRLKESPVQLGGLGRLSFVLNPLPLFLSAAAGYESRLEAQPTVAWLVGAAGIGVRVGSLRAPLALELRSEFLVRTGFDRGRRPLRFGSGRGDSLALRSPLGCRRRVVVVGVRGTIGRRAAHRVAPCDRGRPSGSNRGAGSPRLLGCFPRGALRPLRGTEGRVALYSLARFHFFACAERHGATTGQKRQCCSGTAVVEWLAV